MDEANVAKVAPSQKKASAASSSVLGILMFSLAALLGFVSIDQERPPAAVSANAPATEFSSGRAMKYLEVISRKPHPIGSAEHDVVRDYLTRELTNLGLQPEVQRATVTSGRQRTGSFLAGTVQNVVARMPGKASSKAILLVGHYDSVHTSHGASDDGVAVTAVLETVRALKAGDPLKDDLIVLFTDGEETGLLGATAFVDEHAWAKDVGLVLNFEARGNTGPSMMFETSDRNGWLIREFAKAAPRPVANSFSVDIYKRLPNKTDLTVFKGAGRPGFNFAFINGWSHYHTLLDNFQEIDERTLQHQGSYALALTRHFGNLDLNRTEETNAVYFDVFGVTMMHYPGTWVLPLTFAVSLLFIAVVVVGIRSGQLTLFGLGFGFLAFLSTLIAAPVIISLVAWLIRALHGFLGVGPRAYAYDGALLSFLCLTLTIVSVIYVLFRKRVSTENLVAGVSFGWLILLLVSSFVLRGASYLFVWPLLFCVIGLALVLSMKPSAGLRMTILSLCALPTIILWTPAIYSSYVALTINAGTLLVALMVLPIGMLMPQFHLLTAANRWLLPGTALLLGVALIVVGLWRAGFDRQHPKMDNLFYALNADAGKAVWASFDEKTDEWTSQFFPDPVNRGKLTEIFPSNQTSFLRSDAPIPGLAAPNISLLADQVNNEGNRTLRLLVTSPRQAPICLITTDSQVFKATVNGKHIKVKEGSNQIAIGEQWVLEYYGVPSEGIELIIETPASQAVKISVEDRSYGLPQIPGLIIRPRPDYLMPVPSPLSDMTLVIKNFNF